MRVIQVVDSLQAGGMESVALNLANLLPQHGVTSYLCSTRATGPLEARIAAGVRHLHLARKGPIGLRGLGRLAGFLREQQVDLIHAHGTALFISTLAGLFSPRPRIIWHDHFGRYATQERPAWIYRLAASRIAGVLAVNGPLARWARAALRVPVDRVWYVPNFVPEPKPAVPPAELLGAPGKRIVCVANLRPEKDHLMLIDAMKIVAQTEPSVCLLLAGGETEPAQVAKVKERIHQHGLAEKVFLLGSRSDVSSVLRGCDVGVLSSASEGMPLALLEYGMAGLPTVATRIGQVPEVLDEGRAGILVAPGQSAELAAALLKLLQSPELRQNLGAVLKRRVREHYSETVVMHQILRIYETVLNPPTAHK